MLYVLCCMRGDQPDVVPSSAMSGTRALLVDLRLGNTTHDLGSTCSEPITSLG